MYAVSLAIASVQQNWRVKQCPGSLGPHLRFSDNLVISSVQGWGYDAAWLCVMGITFPCSGILKGYVCWDGELGTI